MPAKFDPIVGAAGFQMSNPSVVSVICLHAALQAFQQAFNGEGLTRIRAKSESLTGYLELLLTSSSFYIPLSKLAARTDTTPGFTIITPLQAQHRGAQLSLLFLPRGSGVMEAVSQYLQDRGVIGDERQPDVLRLSPVPLYNTFKDVLDACLMLEEALQAESRKSSTATV